MVDRLALTLELDLSDQLRPEQRTRSSRRPGARGRLLVILDDLWDVDLGRWLLAEVLPADRALLVTSRDLAVSRPLCGHVRRLDVLPEDEALALLTNILGPLGDQHEAGKEVVELVEGLPLALELAAKLCDNGAADLPWLAGRLRTSRNCPF